MRHTLQEFRSLYNQTEHVQLVFGVHLVNIEFSAEGSAALVRVFNDTKFDLVSYDGVRKLLVLRH